jgi:hypothetical protein
MSELALIQLVSLKNALYAVPLNLELQWPAIFLKNCEKVLSKQGLKSRNINSQIKYAQLIL